MSSPTILGIPLLVFMILLYFGWVIAIILWRIVSAFMGRNRILVEILSPARSYRHKKMKVKEDKIIVKKASRGDTGQSFNLHPDVIFEEDKPSYKFWRNPKRKVLWVEGMTEAIKFSKKGKDASELKYYLTTDEVKKLVKAEVTKAKSQFKPMSRIELILILAFQGFTMVLIFLILNRLG